MILTTLDYLYAFGAVAALIIPSIDLIRTRKVKKVWYKRITCIGWLIIILAIYLGCVSVYGASILLAPLYIINLTDFLFRYLNFVMSSANKIAPRFVIL